MNRSGVTCHTPLQSATLDIGAALARAREQLDPHEWEVFLSILTTIVARENARLGEWV